MFDGLFCSWTRGLCLWVSLLVLLGGGEGNAEDTAPLEATVNVNRYCSPEEKAILTRILKQDDLTGKESLLARIGIGEEMPSLALRFRMRYYHQGVERYDIVVFDQRDGLRKIPNDVPIVILVFNSQERLLQWEQGPAGMVSSLSIRIEPNRNPVLTIEVVARQKIGNPRIRRNYKIRSG